ncbi:MAG: hypothetical protein H6622_11410 [Halobacteriovoraceae bacterium]|nr:hypothetical protein [Halobacteriovoraceae bacterium]
MELIFSFFSNYLIEFMSCLLAIGLGFRFASYKSSVRNHNYFQTFTSELQKSLINMKTEGEVKDVEQFIDNVLEDVRNKLPSRSVRNFKKSDEASKSSVKGNVVSLREYVHGEQSFYHSIKNESVAFQSKFPPNFYDLTQRILEKDDQYNKLFSLFPIGPVSRLINVLPGLFVVLGIFGTFIGISMALPEIAKMDFSNLDGAGEILNSFVLRVTFAMSTSIAGIFYSLITTILNTLAPVKGLREKTNKQVANCFENLWKTIHGQKTIETELKEALPALISEVKMLRSDMKEKKLSA